MTIYTITVKIKTEADNAKDALDNIYYLFQDAEERDASNFVDWQYTSDPIAVVEEDDEEEE